MTNEFWDAPSPPFIEYNNGLPYDVVWYRGKKYRAPISYELETQIDGFDKTKIRCWISNQSGVMIETPSATLLFDWYRCKLPRLRVDKPLHIFISHIHPDHFNSDLLKLPKRLKDVQIYMGYDYSDDWLNEVLEKLPENCSDSISCFRGNQRLFIDGGIITTLDSTDLGVAFLVKIDETTFFHGGDLFPWGGNRYIDFLNFTAPLQNVEIDYAMLPLDPRFPEAAKFCITRYLQCARITCFSPVHLWDKPEFIDVFASTNPDLCKGLLFPRHTEQSIETIIAGSPAQIRRFIDYCKE